MDPFPPVIALPSFFALGAVLGSFGNVLIDRLPYGRWPTGRSHCEDCKRTLTMLELVPIVSWIVLRGQCYQCKSPIPGRFTLVELGSALLFVAAILWTSFDVPSAILIALALWAMLLIAVIDLQTKLIPDILTVVIAGSGLLLQFIDGSINLLPAIIGAGFFAMQWIISRGRWVGSGDIYLGGALGLFLASTPLMLVALLVSYVTGALVAVVLLAGGMIKRKAHMPFGPFLVLGTVVAFFYGSEILNMLLRA